MYFISYIINNQSHDISIYFSCSNSNGKEKDYESGFHYYGARYYWSELLTGWLSVDPMMDKYPSISPYAYCDWNPVMLIDPDGRTSKLTNGWPPPFIKKWNRLSRKEKSFVLWDIRFYKLGVVETNAKTAQDAAKDYYPAEKGKGDKRDAFRHALWQALNVQSVGEELTRDWANAHEYETRQDELMDMYMDVHNNEVGIEIGVANPKASLKDLCGVIKERILNGDMLIINDNDTDLIKSNGNPVKTSEIRGLNSATKIAIDILNGRKNEAEQAY